MARPVSIEEAANLLNVSTKTIRRHLQSKKLSGQKLDGRWTVNLPVDHIQAIPKTVNTEDKIKHLESLIKTIQDERDWLRQQVEHLTITNANLVATVYQQQLEPGKSPPPQSLGTEQDRQTRQQADNNSRPWWKFWAA